MSEGENHARQALYDELELAAKDLTNGSADNPEKIGHAVGLLIRALRPIFEETFVTERGLEIRLGAFRADCPVHSEYVRKLRNSEKFRFALGPVSWQGTLSMIACVALAFVFFVGKGKGWW